MHAADAFWHFMRTPCRAMVARDHDRADIVIADPALTWLRAAQKHRAQPRTIRCHDDRLTHEGARPVKQRIDRTPCQATIRRNPVAHECGILMTRQLRRVHQPEAAVGCCKQHRILLRASWIVRELLRRTPYISTGGKP